MRSKKVTRYWCDHCNKAGLSAGHMSTHEKHCTMNPDRSCRVCGILGGPVVPDPEGLQSLIAILPAGPGPDCGDELNTFAEQVKAAIPKLRESSDDCPACIFAALRQAKISPTMAYPTFDFSAEMKAIFADIEPRQGYDY